MMGGLFGGGQTISTSEQRLGALRVQTSAYGYPIPIVYGTTRITANLIWYGDFQAIAHTSTQSSGGKGGGGVTQENTTYTYQTAVAMGLCEGPISSIGTVWATKKITTLAELGLTLFTGSYPQSPWGYLNTYHPSQAIGYQGLAYVCNGGYQLGNMAELPNHSFEVAGKLLFGSGIVDANPKDVLNDFLTNANYGACPANFPLASLTQYSNYCVAYGLFISPAISEQRPAADYVKDLLQLSNSAPVFSEGVLKIIPYGDTAATGNGATFTPDITPVYDFTDDDFISDSGDPVLVSRKTTADAFNQVQIEFINRANQYNVETAEAKDQANIEQYGLRPMQPIKMHGICDAAIARKIAQLILQRALYIRNEYKFKLGWRYCLLEPMDIVTLTDPGMSLDKFQVRITEIEEAEDGELAITAEEFPFGVAHAPLYSYQTAYGYSINYNVPAVATGAPIIFEAPVELSDNAFEIWLAAAATGNWGGCDVWISSDNVTYKRVGSIHGAARMGVLSQVLPAAGDPDTGSTLAVDLTSSAGTMLSGTQDDADALHTLCYVDGELVSYKTATLTATNKYNLSYLRRGAYNTDNASHAIGSKFVRLDDALLHTPYSPDQIGKTVYFKFPSFNIYGGGAQDISLATAYSYTLVGPPAPATVLNFSVHQSGGAVVFRWQRPAKDFSIKGFDIRFAPKGTTDWNVMTPLTEASAGTEMTNASVPAGSWIFAIKARNVADKLSTNYAWAEFVVTVETNSILSASEGEMGWPGAVTNFYKHWTGVLIPYDQHPVSFYTAWTSFATSLLPTPVTSASYDSGAYDLAYNDTLRVYSVITATPMPGYSGSPNTTFSIDSWLTGASDPATWTAWINDLVALRYLRGRIAEVPTTVPCFISNFVIDADAPAGFQRDNGVVASAGASGTSVTFVKPFHFPPFIAATYNGSGAYIATATNETGNGFTIHVYNTSGTEVGGGPVSWKAEGV